MKSILLLLSLIFASQAIGQTKVTLGMIQGGTNLVSATGITKLKTCYYSFGGASATLASPTECTTGTCVEVYDSCGTGTAPTWSTPAYYNAITFAAGTFANSSHIYCSCEAYDVTTNNLRDCRPVFLTGQQSWQTTASGGYSFTVIPIDTANNGVTGYVQVKCEAPSP